MTFLEPHFEKVLQEKMTMEAMLKCIHRVRRKFERTLQNVQCKSFLNAMENQTFSMDCGRIVKLFKFNPQSADFKVQFIFLD